MKFKLYVIKNGERKTWVYDNEDNSFYDENGNELLTEYKVNRTVYETIKQFSPTQSSYYYKKEFGLLEIMLGANCNFDCFYCSQRTFKDKFHSSRPSDVPSFIEKIKEAGIIPHEIQLWGGEPLVYWKTIEKLVPELRKLFPDINISFPTNGSLLTRDKVDFVKKWNVRFWVSHDGCGNSGREYDGHDDIMNDPVVFDAILYAQKTLPPMGISFKATYTHGNCNAEKIIKFFHKKIDPKAKVSLNNVVLCHDSSNPISVESSKLDSADKRDLTESTFNMLNQTNQNEIDISTPSVRDSLVNCFINRAKQETVDCECGLPTGKSVTVDLTGNILDCHNFTPTHEKRDIRDIEKYQPLGYHHFTQRLANCKDCLVLFSCLGACPRIDNVSHKLTCENSYALHYGVFKAAIASLFGVFLDKVEPL